MKKGWQTKRLGDVCEIIKGRKPVLKATPEDGDLPYLVAKVMRGSQEPQYVSATDRNAVPVAESETIIICDGSNSGEVFTGFRGVLSSTMGKLLKKAEIDDDYLRAFLASTFDVFNGTKTGAAIPHLDKDAMYQLSFPLPPLPEQQRIAGILVEAFESISAAKAYAERNLQNARAIFESHLQSVFTHGGHAGAAADGEPDSESLTHSVVQAASRYSATDAEKASPNGELVTKTGGRKATLRHIPGKLSLAVGMSRAGARRGWRWSALTDLARLESGHTPSRKHPEYWGGSVPWIGIQDARENHGQRIADTIQTTNELGIANSSARVIPQNTVCLSRTASVGYVVVMGRPMATSQDFVNWVCSEKLNPDFLKYLILAEGREGLLRYASGSVHQTIYFPEAKAFHICYPGTDEQDRIVQQCDALATKTLRLTSLYKRKLDALEALKNSLLHQAFTGKT